MQVPKFVKDHTNSADNFDNIAEIVSKSKMLGYNILVKPLEVAAQTAGGLILADSTKSNIENLMSVGKVVAMGDQCFANVDYRGHVMYDEDGNVKYNPKAYEVGDWVVWPKLNGKPIILGEQNFKILSDDEPFMTVEDPSLISKYFQFA